MESGVVQKCCSSFHVLLCSTEVPQEHCAFGALDFRHSAFCAVFLFAIPCLGIACGLAIELPLGKLSLGRATLIDAQVVRQARVEGAFSANVRAFVDEL